ASFTRPAIHERQPVLHVLRVGGDRRSLAHRLRNIIGGELLQRPQQSGVSGIENKCVGALRRTFDQLGEESCERSTQWVGVHVSLLCVAPRMNSHTCTESSPYL